MEEVFEAGVKQALPLFRSAKGCMGLEFGCSVEKPTRYRLFAQWHTLEMTQSISASRLTSPGLAQARRALL